MITEKYDMISRLYRGERSLKEVLKKVFTKLFNDCRYTLVLESLDFIGENKKGEDEVKIRFVKSLRDLDPECFNAIVEFSLLTGKEDIAGLFDSGHSLWLVFCRGKSAGITWIKGFCRTIWITRLEVFNSFRNRGLAKKLVKEVCTYHFSNGFDNAKCTVHIDNTLSLRCFESTGFSVSRRIYHDRFHKILKRCDLWKN